MKSKKMAKYFIVSGMVLSMCSATYAYNYKFDVNVDTSASGAYGYSSYAYKYATDEDAVLKVTSMDNQWDADVMVVNSNNEQRSTSKIVTSAPWSGVLGNYGMEQNHKYKLRIKESKPASPGKSYNLRGWWNPDEY